MEEIVEEIFQDLSYTVSQIMEKYGFIREDSLLNDTNNTDQELLGLPGLVLLFKNNESDFEMKVVIRGVQH